MHVARHHIIRIVDPRIQTMPSRPLAALQEAVATMLAAIATLLSVLAIDAESGPAILAVVLSLSLSRSHLDHGLRERLEAAIAMPLVALGAVAVGLLLHRMPWIGALVFTAALSASIWLRRFGELAGRAGTLIALPLVTLLVTPYAPAMKVPAPLAHLMPVVVALIALASVTVFQTLARRVKLLPPAKPRPDAPPSPRAESALRPDATTRMAIQMAVAIALSFVVGYVFFAERWSWIVLTAFIVLSGNRGRLDVAYKSVLRVAGAAGGTIVAMLISQRHDAGDPVTVALMLVAVFLGLWLRPLGYAWWALFVTIALALLQDFTGAAQPMLALRLEEIAIGAIIGVATAWLVLPVRSTAVLRRRIADALAALSEALDPANAARSPEAFVAMLARVEQLAPAFRAARRVAWRSRRVNPADWIDALGACSEPAVALITSSATPGAARKAAGAARKAVREPDTLLPALRELRQALMS
jgi:fusaric acid resistance family protein